MRHLAEAWLRTVAAVDARGDVAEAGARLLGRYADPARSYHGLAHLDDVLRHVDELAHHAAHLDTVRLAAWFHDAVYDPAAADNEDASARLAVATLTELRVADEVVEDVARLVRVTASHEVAAGDADAAVLCDADLAVLASSPPDYARYVAAVRAEYAALDDTAFAAGRTAVLEGLRQRNSLFSTPTGHASWEARARTNVNAELARLTGGTED